MNKYNKDKIMNVGVLCGGRSQGRTYHQFIEIYKKARQDGFTDVNIRFIAPDIIELKKDIETILNDIREKYMYMMLGKIKLDYEELLFQLDERIRKILDDEQ